MVVTMGGGVSMRLNFSFMLVFYKSSEITYVASNTFFFKVSKNNVFLHFVLSSDKELPILMIFTRACLMIHAW